MVSDYRSGVRPWQPRLAVPTYEYRCATCGAELTIEHKADDAGRAREHLAEATLSPCFGPLERLISRVRQNRRIGTRGPSDRELERAGFSKYVRGDDGRLERAFGPGLEPDHLEEHR